MVLLPPVFCIAVTNNSEFWTHISNYALGISVELKLPEFPRSKIKIIIFSSKSVSVFKFPFLYTGAIIYMVIQTRNFSAGH